MRFVKKRLGVNKEVELSQAIAILEFQEQKDVHGRPRRAHPVHSSDAISIFRPLNGEARWDIGFFGIYASSHHQTHQEFSASEKDVHKKRVETYEVFVLSGGSLLQKGGSEWFGRDFQSDLCCQICSLLMHLSL